MRYFGIIAITLLFLLQLSFLNADPDIKLCCSRDAWNAEGINTVQLRNYINQGYLSFTECHNLLKMPLLNLLLFLPLKFVGTDLSIARISILLIVLLAVIYFTKITSLKELQPVLAVVCLSQLYVFEYSHLVMAEMISVVMILIAIGFFYSALRDSVIHSSKIIFSVLFSALGYYAKIQFAYIIVLIPVSMLLIKWQRIRVIPSSLVWKSILWSMIFMLIYFLTWYWPNHSFFNRMMAFEAADKFPAVNSIPITIWQNIRINLLGTPTRFFVLFAFITFIIGCWHYLKNGDAKFKILFTIICVWMLLESHRLLFAYFPPRYRVSLFFAMGMIASVVIASVLFSEQRNRVQKVLVISLLMCFIVTNSSSYLGELSRRQYSIRDINNYMKQSIHDPSKTVLGSWAPGITWESKSRAVPVWKDFLNDKNTIATFHPVAVITEPNEVDSRGAFKSQGIDLVSISDSSRSFDVGPWKLIVYWMKQN